MAEETKTTAETPAPAAEVVVSDVSEAVVVDKEANVTTVKPEPEPISVPEAEKPAEEPAATEGVPAAEEAEKAAEVEKIGESTSFKEETNVVEELPDPQQKAIDELKQLIREALAKHEFTAPPPSAVKEEEKKPELEEPKPEATTEEPKTETTVEETKAEATVEETKTEAAAEETKPTEEEKKEAEAVPPPAEEPPKAEEPVEPVKEKKEVVPPPTETAETLEPVTKVEAAVEEIKETIVEETTATVTATEEAVAPAAEPAEEAPKEEVVEVPPKEPEEVSLWGIPLLADERSDVILLKFLRARDFKVKDALAMLKSVVAWRKEFGIDKLLKEEGIGSGLEKAVYMHGVDKEGHPVCYNVYGEFQDKEVYQIAFADAEKRSKFLKWRIHFLENSIRKLDFTPDGVNTIVQINDLQNSPGLFFFKKDFRQATNQAVQLLQDNYPEFVAKQVFINVPWWYVAYNRMMSPFLTQRTKSKFIFVGPSKTAETLFKYIAPQQVPVQYGGLSREDGEFSVSEPATEDTIKPSTKLVVELPVTEGTFVWEARVIGWEVSYGAEFTPSAEGGYTVIVQKPRKITPTDEPIITGSYKIGEPGKILLTFGNQTSKKKKLLYRSKIKSE